MTSTSFVRDTLDNIIDLSIQIGSLQAQRTYKMYGPQDAIVEHGLREALYEKKQELIEMIVRGSVK